MQAQISLRAKHVWGTTLRLHDAAVFDVNNAEKLLNSVSDNAVQEELDQRSGSRTVEAVLAECMCMTSDGGAVTGEACVCHPGARQEHRAPT